MKKKLFFSACLVLCMIMIFIFSAQSGDISGELSKGITYKIARIVIKDFSSMSVAEQTGIVKEMHFYIRKAAHFSEYAMLGVFAYINASLYLRKTSSRFLISLPFCLIYAATDEIHQLFSKGRSGNPVDVMIDFSGAFTGTVAMFFIMGIVMKIRSTFSEKERRT